MFIYIYIYVLLLSCDAEHMCMGWGEWVTERQGNKESQKFCSFLVISFEHVQTNAIKESVMQGCKQTFHTIFFLLTHRYSNKHDFWKWAVECQKNSASLCLEDEVSLSHVKENFSIIGPSLKLSLGNPYLLMNSDSLCFVWQPNYLQNLKSTSEEVRTGSCGQNSANEWYVY